MIRKTLAAAAILGLIGLGATACGIPASGVTPSDGPATAAPANPTTPSTTTDPTTTESTPTEEPTTEESLPTEEDTPAEPAPANFHQKYTYEDGVQVDVIKIQHSKVTGYDAEINDGDVKKGDSVVYMEVRAKNGSKKTLDAYGSWTVTYGPDGTEAQSPYLPKGKETTDMSGKILRGKSKTGSDAFIIPAKYQGDVTLEFTVDFDHESAVFTGSVK